MFSSFAQEQVQIAERAAAAGNSDGAFEALRALPFADFCELILSVPPSHPALHALLPKMPSAEAQKRWVGDHGRLLMVRSCSLIRLFELTSWRYRGRSLEGANILDYGCGWGRLLRLLYHKTSQATIFGVDPMQESLQHCKDCGLKGNIAKCDAVPRELPFGRVLFDFVFSFSVFTHVPREVADAILRAIRQRISPDGVLVVTVRSHEFWELRRPVWNPKKVDALIADHLSTGYAFVPLETGGLKSEEYGDTTYSRQNFERLCNECGWNVAGVERDMTEPFQIAVVLKPR